MTLTREDIAFLDADDKALARALAGRARKARRAVTVNTAQQLYVIPTSDGRGYSCLGFAVAERKARAVAEWADVAPPTARPGTLAHYRQYARIMQQGASFHALTGRRCDAELIPELVGLEGRRIEVTDADGYVRRYIVGKSTGWMPCHLEIANARSTGGSSAFIGESARVRLIR